MVDLSLKFFFFFNLHFQVQAEVNLICGKGWQSGKRAAVALRPFLRPSRFDLRLAD